MNKKLISIEDYATLIKNAAEEAVGKETDVSLFLSKLVTFLGGKIEVIKEPNEYEMNGGSLIINEDGSFVINLPPFTSPFRDNFTIAHELGHFFIHYKNDNQQRIFYRYGNDEKEKYADRFAACFLMPKKEFLTYQMDNQASILQLSAKFQVSTSAIKFRIDLLKND